MKLASNCLLFLLTLTPVLGAQTGESLLIGRGDLVHVQVFDTPELDQRARVTDSGEISLLMGGSVQIARLTPAAAAQAIESALLQGHFLLHPRVLVTVEEYATQKVSVAGEVRSPGAYNIATPRAVLDVLTLAGGMNDMADRNIFILRFGSNEKVKYFVPNAPEAEARAQVTVNPGDMIIVPRAGIVYALGDFGRPGGFAITNNEGRITALQLIARAGGMQHSAAPAHAKLIRKAGSGYVEIALSLKDMQNGKREDVELQADDIVFLPFSYLRNFALSVNSIVGQVGSAAVYKF